MSRVTQIRKAAPAGPARTAREAAVWEALADVADPEIPAISVVDLGVIRRVAFQDEPNGQRLRVEIMPTFVGCPAIDVMQGAIREKLAEHAAHVEVVITFDEPWTSERITPEGRQRLRESGFGPPAPTPSVAAEGLTLLDVLPSPSASLQVSECPYCGSHETALENAFGPTLCRAIYYCRGCRQPFEQFKSV